GEAHTDAPRGRAARAVLVGPRVDAEPAALSPRRAFRGPGRDYARRAERGADSALRVPGVRCDLRDALDLRGRVSLIAGARHDATPRANRGGGDRPVRLPTLP